MQDKKPHTPSPEETLANEAWAQMAKLLDEQMPVAVLPWWQQQRYRAILLLLLLLLSAAAWWWSGSEVTPTSPIPELPAAIAQQGVIETDDTKASQQVAPTLTETNEVSSPQSNVLVPPAARKATSAQTPGSTEIAQTFTRRETVQDADSEIFDTRLSVKIPEQLPGLELLPLALSVQAPGHTAMDLITPPSRWSLSTTAGVGMQNPGHISLGWLDMRVQRKLGNADKWSLGTGLGILYAQFPGRSEYGGIYIESASSGSPDEFTNFDNLSIAEIQALQEATLAMRYTFLRMPLEVNRRLTTRLHLRFGAEAGLLLNATSTSEYRADQSLSNSALPSISDVLQTKRLDTRLHLGLGYRFSSNLEADLRYQFGLVKLHPQYPVPTYNRFLELGLRWNW
jgi:hypothetical protein